MTDRLSLSRSLVYGVIAGLAGGVVIYAATGRTLSVWPAQAAMPQVVEALTAHSAVAGLAVHLLFSAIVGAGFALLLGRFSRCAGYSIMWSMTYALLWWIAVPLAFSPLAAGRLPGWSVEDARDAFPLLVAYLTGYGIVGGVVYSLLGAWPPSRSSAGAARGAGFAPWTLLRVVVIGGVAGSLAGWILGTWPVSAGTLSPSMTLVRGASTGLGGFAFWLGSFVLGAIYGFLYRSEIRGAGSSMAWGVAYGYLWWVLGELTLLPIGLGRGVTWSLESGRSSFSGLTSYLIWGLLLGVVYAALDRIWRELFAESLPWEREPEGPAERGLRALGIGLLAGAFGGVVYGVALSYGDGLATLAGLAGARSAAAGFLVAIAGSALLGALYGVLFRHGNYSHGAALIWGLVYGSVLWFVGRLWLIPVMLGQVLPWKLSDVLQAYPWLMAEFAYGAALALAYQYLAQQRAAGRRAALRREARSSSLPARVTPAPALWVLVLMLSVLLPMLLAG